MSEHPHEAALEAIRRHYESQLSAHGDTPQGVQWSDRRTQEARMAVLADIGHLDGRSLLDFGCGTGHLLEFLRRDRGFQGFYTGYDIAEPMVEVARSKFPDAVFERRDILADGIEDAFDYVLVNGTFNNRLDDGWSLVRDLLATLFAATRKGLAFNLLSTYVDFHDDELAYYEPEVVFAFSKSLTPLVTLRHDYRLKPGVIPFEFTVYLRRDDA